ncbi:MAG: hypothetical protein IJF32_08885 [Oscillospiraceae bacterium]|nr:hypothetical protein [Oscillospiraceae bacterium]
MNIKKTAVEIWAEFEKGKTYNKSIDLYENVKKCENFYIGKQWEGLNAPDLPKPVLNVTKRVVSYFIAMLVSDDVGILLEPYKKTKTWVNPESYAGGDPALMRAFGSTAPIAFAQDDMRGADEPQPTEIVKEELDARVIETEVDKTIERCNIKAQARKIVRNAAVDGDAYMYFYFDGSIDAGNGAEGGIVSEVLDNTSVIFGNPYKYEVQKQPYIIIATPCMLSDVREEAKRNGLGEDVISQIHADDDTDIYTYKQSGTSDLCTVITKLWKEQGTVHAMKITKDIIIRDEWDTGYDRYPIANMVWEEIKNSYHGQSAVLQVIPNQICINQLYAMTIHWTKMNALPKTVYDATKIAKWSNKVGQAIGVVGNPNDAVASAQGGASMSPQVTNLINGLMQHTAEYMGANDAALGNVKPDNAEAIIATQNAAAMPLEIQKLEYYRFTEEAIRIMIDIIREDYGLRPINVTCDGNAFEGLFDFSTLSDANYNMKVEIGQSSYWSELTQIQTADNLLAKGIIPDAVTYLESIPDKFIRNKAKIVKQIKEAAKMQETAGAQAPIMQGQEIM